MRTWVGSRRHSCHSFLPPYFQGMTGVCGAASVAGALNACREHISRERVGWSDILYDVYRDLFGLRVFRLSRREGRLVATSRYVSNRHVVRATPGGLFDRARRVSHPLWIGCWLLLLVCLLACRFVCLFV